MWKRLLKISYLIIICLTISGCILNRNHNLEFTLSGRLDPKTLGDMTVGILSYMDVSQTNKSDTILIKNNRFRISGNINGATNCSLTLKNLTEAKEKVIDIHFFLEPTSIILRLSSPSPSALKLEIVGSNTETESRKLDFLTDPIYSSLDPLILKRNYLVQHKRDDLVVDVQKTIDSIDRVQEVKLHEIKKIRINFIENNYNSHVSSYWLFFYLRELPLSDIKRLYSRFSAKIKEDFYALEVLKYVEKSESNNVLEIDSIFPNFELQSLSDTSVHLDKFKEKKLLIVFWASWCGPCRDEIPFLKDLYTKYKSSKFDFINISLDDSEFEWKKAVLNDKPPGVQLLETEGFKSEWIGKLGVVAIPEYILVDTGGRIFKKGFNKNQLEGNILKLIKL